MSFNSNSNSGSRNVATKAAAAFDSPYYFPGTIVRLPSSLSAWKKKFKQVGKKVFVHSTVSLEDRTKKHGAKAVSKADHLTSYQTRLCNEKELAEWTKGKEYWDRAFLAAKIHTAEGRLRAQQKIAASAKTQAALSTRRAAAAQVAIEREKTKVVAVKRALTEHTAKMEASKKNVAKPAAPAKKVAAPAKKVAAPAKKVAAPAKKVAAPAKKVAAPAKKVAAPAKKVAAKAWPPSN